MKWPSSKNLVFGNFVTNASTGSISGEQYLDFTKFQNLIDLAYIEIATNTSGLLPTTYADILNLKWVSLMHRKISMRVNYSTRLLEFYPKYCNFRCPFVQLSSLVLMEVVGLSAIMPQF